MLHRVIDLRTIADVGFECCSLAAKLFNLGSDFAHLIGIDVDNSNIGAIFCQAQGNATSDPLSRTGHKRHFSIECHWGVPFASAN